jgi:3',5'-nucleoside bisphosphate phosphatase
MITKTSRLLGLFVVWALADAVVAYEPVVRSRTPVAIPDLPGYVTLKCDFHIHTVFSDGLVWPTVRVEEAWREGLDAIAITDHIEYLPHQRDLPVNHNRAYEIARPQGEALDIIVIRGSEITRGMPPGHLNAIFLTDSAALDVEDWREAVAEAKRQGAFIFWNHPGWSAQLQADGVVRWYPEHTELLEAGLLHGIEVANGRSVYPEALAWGLEKPLTLLSNSDIHNPLNLDYQVHAGDHRPLTLVFARERSASGIQEALVAQRTAVYASHRLMGEQQYLEPLFAAAVTLRTAEVTLAGDRGVNLQIHNHSDVPFLLERSGALSELSFPSKLTLPPHRTVLAQVRSTATDLSESRALRLPYRVTNLLVGPDRSLETGLDLRVNFLPK